MKHVAVNVLYSNRVKIMDQTASTPTNRPPSIRKIAKQAGVSASTVSRVLNNRSTAVPIAEQTRQKVLQACETLRYQPNIHALRLFSGRSNCLAAMIPPLGLKFRGINTYSDTNLQLSISGMMRAASEAGLHLMLFPSDSRMLEKEEHLNLFRNRSIDGMLIWGATPRDMPYVTELEKEGWPVVLLNSHVSDEKTPHIRVDNYKGADTLAKHLIDLGHEKISYISGPDTSDASRARYLGFTQACTEAKVQLTIHQSSFEFENGQTIARQIFTSNDRPTAIAAVNDMVALGVLDTADELGIKVPDELSVTGADDIFPYYKPRLTTFATPMEKLGQTAVRLMIEILNNTDHWPDFHEQNKHIIPGQLIIGSTTRSIGPTKLQNSD
jgi:LacI family transcriptional regulator